MDTEKNICVNLNGFRFPISIKIKKDFTVSVNAYFPHNYPDTNFKKINGNMSIAYLSSIFDTQKDMFRLYYFVVYSKTPDRKYAKDEELMKGLGKKMLCTILKELIKNKKITRNASITLAAAGGRYTPECKKHASSMSDNEIELFLKQFPKENIGEDIRQTYCIIKDNMKLVDYYKQYGLFTTKDKDGYGKSVEMNGEVKQVLKQCSTRKSFGKPRKSKAIKSGKVIKHKKHKKHKKSTRKSLKKQRKSGIFQ